MTWNVIYSGTTAPAKPASSGKKQEELKALLQKFTLINRELSGVKVGGENLATICIKRKLNL